MQEPQTKLTPPPRRAPPGQQSGSRQAHPGSGTKTPGFDAVFVLQRFNNDTQDKPPVLWNVFLVPT